MNTLQTYCVRYNQNRPHPFSGGRNAQWSCSARKALSAEAEPGFSEEQRGKFPVQTDDTWRAEDKCHAAREKAVLSAFLCMSVPSPNTVQPVPLQVKQCLLPT